MDLSFYRKRTVQNYDKCPKCDGRVMCNGHRYMCLSCDWNSDKR